MKLSSLAKKVGVYIDDEDLARFGHLSAYIDDQFRIKVSLGSREAGKVFLHKLVLGTPKEAVDHINGNPCDNRKSNLRLATLSQNQGNRVLNANNTSGYKGVRYHKLAKKFVARITIKGVETYLGLHATAIDAARAYNEAALKHFGEFAKLNGVDHETI